MKHIEQVEERATQGSSSVGPESIDVQEAVRRRAYQIYEQRGMGPGSEIGDWLQAEAELRDSEGTQVDTIRPQKDNQRTERAA